jgi:hypothetical protein
VEGQETVVQFAAVKTELCLFYIAQTKFGACPFSCLMGTELLFQTVKESEAHIFQVPVIRMNAALPLCSVCPHGVSREN